ncbi:MAG: flagellar hook assembly protein FlgD [Pseudomonadota bacterium]
MQVDATTSATTASTANSTSQAATVDYDTFLRLLVAQIENQDPTNPMDSTEQVAQLATFSQVEQTIQTNAKLDQMLTLSAVSQVDGLIGRTLTSSDGSVSGEVKSVLLTQSGARAILTNGGEVQLDAGVLIT